MTIRIDAKVICRRCRGTGFTLQTAMRDVGCETCGERGYTLERVELDTTTLIALGYAIQSAMAAEEQEIAERLAAETARPAQA